MSHLSLLTATPMTDISAFEPSIIKDNLLELSTDDLIGEIKKYDDSFDIDVHLSQILAEHQRKENEKKRLLTTKGYHLFRYLEGKYWLMEQPANRIDEEIYLFIQSAKGMIVANKIASITGLTSKCPAYEVYDDVGTCKVYGPMDELTTIYNDVIASDKLFSITPIKTLPVGMYERHYE